MLLAITILAVLILLNGVLAMAELAMMTSRPSRLQQSAAAGSRGAAMALTLSREPTRFLSTVQVGITLIGILAGAFGENALSDGLQEAYEQVPVLSAYSDEAALLTVVLVITYFSLVIGELVPKRLALTHPEAIASAIARPLDLLSKIAALPVRILTLSTEGVLKVLRVKPRAIDDVSEDDVKSLLSRAVSTGVFTRGEHRLLQRVLRVGDLSAESLMIPRPQIIWVDEKETAQTVRVLVGTSPHSHYPICRGSIDRVVGVIHIKDLISYGLLAGADFEIAAVATPPQFVPETTPALRLLDLFEKSGSHIAFVVDEYGAVRGLITLKDVVAAVFGEFPRSGSEALSVFERRDDGSWILDGSMPLHEMVTALDIPPEAEAELPSVHTVAGLVLARLGRIPTTGDLAEWRGLTLRVIKMDGTRIAAVMVEPARAEEVSDDPAI